MLTLVPVFREETLILRQVNSDKDYRIPFVSLKEGIHQFEFQLTDKFFDSIEYSIINKGNVHVVLALEKKETMLIGNFTISGCVEGNCNRCNDPMNININGAYKLVYKFGNEPSDDESLIIIYPDEFEIDIKNSLFELITVSVPKRTIHPSGECNEEMVEILDEYIMIEEHTITVDKGTEIDLRQE